MFKKFLFLFFIFSLSSSKNFFFDLPLTKNEETQINLKATDTTDKIILLISKLLNVIGENKLDLGCGVCTATLLEFNNILNTHGTKGFFSYINKICLFLYKYENFCDTLIEGYGYVLIDGLIDKFIKNNFLCQKLKFCEDKTKYLNVDDYAKKLLSDKPTKTKEKINKNSKKIKMLQVSDLHYDLHYIENASVDCYLPLCCRDKAKQKEKKISGYYGYEGKCDLSPNLFHSFINKAYSLKPDLIIWTGDNAPHDTWKEKFEGQNDTYYVTEIIRNALDEKFQFKIPIYPLLGNHEIYPNDEFNEKETIFYEKMANIYKKYLSNSAYLTFKKFGYYSMKYPNSNLKIIALNCLLCDTWNYNLINSDKKASKEMFVWLEKELRQSEKNNEYVYILNHFPLTGSFSLEECSKRFIALYDRFEYIIRGVFSGHTHKDDINPIYGYFDRKRITNLNYICPSLTTFPNVLPSFRVYEIDSDTKQIIDYVNYRFNLDKSNQEKKPFWEDYLRATKFFDVIDMTQFKKIINFNNISNYVVNEYCGAKKGKELANNKKAIKRAYCVLKSDSFMEYFKCKNVKFEFSEEMAIVGLNYLMSPWEDN